MNKPPAAPDSYTEFTGSIPENYERHLVPLIFADYAKLLANAVDTSAKLDVLELACGTGIVTRSILEDLPSGSRLLATDINEPMIAQARKAIGNAPQVSFKNADAANLPFSENSFDALVCQFGIMFVSERQKAYGEAARVLRPGGKFHFNVWDRLDANLFANAIHRAMEKRYPDNPPRFLELPYGYSDISLIVGELQSAGFTNIDISVQQLTSHANSPADIALGFGAGGPLANEVAARGTLSLKEVLQGLEKALEEEFGAGPCQAPMQAIQITARTD